MASAPRLAVQVSARGLQGAASKGRSQLPGGKDPTEASPPSPSSPEDATRTQRRLVAEEILSTERTYANELGRFVEVFCPRMEAGDTPAKQRFMQELSGLISNLEQFLFVARQAVQDLSTSSKYRVGPALLRLTSVLPLYTQYAKNYALASKNIRDLMRDEDFLKDWRGEERERSERSSLRLSKSSRGIRRTNSMETTVKSVQAGNTLNGEATSPINRITPPALPARPQSIRVTSLEGFLILPVQRVPRYVLLFQELLNRLVGTLSPVDAKEKADIEQALEAAKNCASDMNSAIENVKRLESLKDLQIRFNNDTSLLPIFTHPEVRIARSDTLTKVSRNGQKKDYIFFLMEPDSILCATEEGDSLRLRRLLKLTPKTCSIEKREEDGLYGFVLETAERVLTIMTTNVSIRDAWVETLTKLILALDSKSAPILPRRSFFMRRQPSAPVPSVSTNVDVSKDGSRSPSSFSGKSTRDSGPGWSPGFLDETSTATSCHVCGTGFSLLTRKHICGRCRRDVCASCSPQRRALVFGEGSPVRCCDICADEMDIVSETEDPSLARIHVEVSGSFRREGSSKAPREPVWGLTFDNQLRGPSTSGRFVYALPYKTNPFPKATLHLLTKQGTVEVARAELDVEEMIRNPRSQHGFTERIDFYDSSRGKIASVCVTLRVDQPPDFIQYPEDLFPDASPQATSSVSDFSSQPRAASSDGQQETRRRSMKRRSLNFSAEKGFEAMLRGVVADHRSPDRRVGRPKVNMALLREYETFSLENPHLIVPARIVDCLLNWAIDTEAEGSEAQTQLSSMLYKFHRRRSTIVRSGSQPVNKSSSHLETKRQENEDAKASIPQPDQQLKFDSSTSMLAGFVETETEYIKKLERLTEKHQQASAMAKTLVFRRSQSANSSPTTDTLLSGGSNRSSLTRGTVLRLASTFGQTQSAASETAILNLPTVFSCLAAAEQMLTIHKSLYADISVLGSDALTRLASLTKVYASYGATLVEAYLAVVQAMSPRASSTSSQDLDTLSLFRLGAGQYDPEDAFRWILTAAGCIRPLMKGGSHEQDPAKWSLLDLLICPLERMNQYCQFARELDSPALAALNETRRLLTKSIMRKCNTRLLRELDNSFLDLDQSLVDVRRWMLRSSPLVLRNEKSPDVLVQVILFSDVIIVANYEGAQLDRWTVSRIIRFGEERPVFIRDAVSVARDASHTVTPSGISTVNTSLPLGDVRFAFEIGTSSDDIMTLLMPNASAMTSNVQRQLGNFWQRLGLVAFDKDTGTAVGPGGFSNVEAASRRAEAATLQSTDRSKDMKRKQQLRLEWVSDISRLVRIWGGAKSDVCWCDDVVQARLILTQKRPDDLKPSDPPAV